MSFSSAPPMKREKATKTDLYCILEGWASLLISVSELSRKPSPKRFVKYVDGLACMRPPILCYGRGEKKKRESIPVKGD